MTAPWTPEQVVSPDLAKALLEEQFPALAPATIEPLGAGFDNTAYRVNGYYAFRFPRRAFAVPLLETEARVLPALAERLPLPIPVPALHGRPSDRYPWPFLGYRLLPGRSACAVVLDDAQRTRAAEPLACFLAALHDVPAAEAEALGGGPDTLGRVDVAVRVPQARGLIEKLTAEGVALERSKLAALVETAGAQRTPARRTPVHGDLYARHLLVDGRGTLCGIIDWGDLHVGSPAVDLSIAWSFLPPAARDRFRRAYGTPIDEDTWRLARLRALVSALMVVDYARAINDADLLREGGKMLSLVVA